MQYIIPWIITHIVHQSMDYFVLENAVDHFVIIDHKHISDDFSETYSFISSHSNCTSILELPLLIKFSERIIDLRKVLHTWLTIDIELRLIEETLVLMDVLIFDQTVKYGALLDHFQIVTSILHFQEGITELLKFTKNNSYHFDWIYYIDELKNQLTYQLQHLRLWFNIILL